VWSQRAGYLADAPGHVLDSIDWVCGVPSSRSRWGTGEEIDDHETSAELIAPANEQQIPYVYAALLEHAMDLNAHRLSLMTPGLSVDGITSALQLLEWLFRSKGWWWSVPATLRAPSCEKRLPPGETFFCRARRPILASGPPLVG